MQCPVKGQVCVARSLESHDCAGRPVPRPAQRHPVQEGHSSHAMLQFMCVACHCSIQAFNDPAAGIAWPGTESLLPKPWLEGRNGHRHRPPPQRNPTVSRKRDHSPAAAVVVPHLRLDSLRGLETKNSFLTDWGRGSCLPGEPSVRSEFSAELGRSATRGPQS